MKMQQDVAALLSGLCLVLILLGMSWLWGDLAGWEASSGYTHNDSANSQNRLMSEPYECDDAEISGRRREGCTGTWYYWKLPPSEATAVTRAVVWLMYSLHQIFIWGLIYRAQLTVARQASQGIVDPYSGKLRWFNWGMLAVNGLFHILHLVQTHTTYDGLAQDVTISSSQASVIMMVCFILLIEYRHRGFAFMWPNEESTGAIANKIRLDQGPLRLIRKYHGYAFSWACIYTFWYHPMENTWGHTLGFFHTAIVLLQGSLAFTKIHLNRYWRLLNECWVLIHATTVAVQTGNPGISAKSDLWPTFAFGFGFVFAFTQIFSLPFWRKVPAGCRAIPALIYVTTVTALCGTIVQGRNGSSNGFTRMIDMFFIPAQEYLQAILSWFVLYMFIRIVSYIKMKCREMRSMEQGESEIHDDPSPAKQALLICLSVTVYALLIFGSYLFQQADYEYNMTTIMIAFTALFSLGACFGKIFMQELLGRTHPLQPQKSNNKVEGSKTLEIYASEVFSAGIDS